MKSFNNIEEAAKKPLQVQRLVIKKGKSNATRPVPWNTPPYNNNGKISAFINLEELTISGYEFDDFSFSFKSLSKLKKLDISYNDFGYWLYSPREKPGVDRYGANHIPYVSSGFYELHNLEYLNFAGNRLGYVEFPTGAFPNLQHLDLSDNARSFYQFPQYDREILLLNLPLLPKLTTLNLNGGQMLDFPAIEHLTSLEFLDLSFNRLKNIPESIQKLTKLKGLTLGLNQFEAFPKHLHLPKLTVLSLYNNQIWWIDEEIGTYTQLKELNLSSNQIESLPSHFFKLKNLEKLDLSYNQLEELPMGFRKLKKLKWLSLVGNPLKQASIEAFQHKHPDVELVSKHNKYWF